MSLRKLTSLIGILAVVGLVAFILFNFVKTNDETSNVSQSESTAETVSETNGVLSDGAENIASQSDESKSGVEIIDSGFGQSSNSAMAIVIAKTSGGSLAGEFVTATVNFLDESGAVVATEDQVETLSWEDQELVLPVSHYKEDSSRPEITSIEAFLSVTDYGSGQPDETALPVLETTDISNPYAGSYNASFALKNDSSDDFKNLRVGIVCYNEQTGIIGGGFKFPNLVPAGGSIRMDASVTVSEMPASCKAYLNH